MQIKYSQNVKVMHPRLAEILALVYAKRPLLEYEVTDSRMGSNGFDREATCVSVWQDGQRLGNINAHFMRYSQQSGMNSTWYALESRTIHKQRGEKNTKFCKDAKAAARIVIDMFAKQTLADLGSSLIAFAKSQIESLEHSVRHDFVYYSFNHEDINNYFVDMHRGLNPPVPKTITDLIVNRDMVRRQDNCRIAKNVLTHMKSGNGYVIEVMRDETLLCARIADPMTTSKHNSTYELAEFLQEKFTMLKLLEKDQFAEDIGIKFQHVSKNNAVSMVYFIVGGATKVIA